MSAEQVSEKSAHTPIFVTNSSCIGRFLSFWLVTLIIHLLMLRKMVDLDSALSTPALQLIAIHGVFAVVLMLFAVYAKWASCGRTMFVLLAGFTAVLGLVGIIGVLLVFVLFLDYGRDARPFEEWYSELFPEENRHYSEELAEKLRISTADTPGGLSPFKDILAFGNQGQKLSMIALVTRHFKPAFASILQEAVNYPDNAIRVQAATAISHVENAYTKKSMELEKQLIGEPENVELLLTTAKHIDEYAFSGLLDDLSTNTNRLKAIGYYHRYLKFKPDDQNALSATSRLLLKNGQLEEAAKLLQDAIDVENPDLKLITWYMDALYQDGKYDLLNQVAKRYVEEFENNTDFPLNVVQSVQIWAKFAP